jgi:hypothetical protein
LWNWYYWLNWDYRHSMKPYERKVLVLFMGFLGLCVGLMRSLHQQHASPLELAVGWVAGALLGAFLVAEAGELIGETIEAVRSLRSR